MPVTVAESLTERNRAIVRSLYDAVLTGDLDVVMGLLDEDVVIDEPAYLPYGGLYRGKAGFAELVGLFGRYLDLSGVVVHYLVADGERVVTCLGIPDSTTGELTHFLEQATVRDGRIVELKLFYYDPQSMMDQPKVDQ
jgi:hypothetical protein